MFTFTIDSMNKVIKSQLWVFCFVTFFVLTGCDLAQNQLKIDRDGNREVQDYRDGLAPRLPEVEKKEDIAGIPDLQPYVADPTDQLKPMPLVSVSVNQQIPLRDVLYELAQQAEYDLELDPRISGSVIFTAKNKPLDVVVDRLCEISGLRYKFVDDILRVEVDTAYHQTYRVNYLSYIRSSESSISNNVSVVTGEGADVGSQFSATANSDADFWGELETNLAQIITASTQTLVTSSNPRVSAVAENPDPLEPIVLDETGELTEPVPAEPPPAVLTVDSLPIDDGLGASSGTTDEQGENGSRFSINKMAGIISVYAPERAQKKVAKYLYEIKRSVTSQVLIEAKILEVSLKDEFSAGIDWSFLNPLSGEGQLSLQGLAANPVTTILRPNFLDDTAGINNNFRVGFDGNDFNGFLDLLSRFGTTKALASPRMTVINNQSAILSVAENVVFFEVDFEREEDADTGDERVEIETEVRTVPEGVIISMLPSIDLDNKTIALSIRPTVTRVDDLIQNPGVFIASGGLIDSDVPQVVVQEFDSVVQMNNGEAAVLGGLIQDRTDSEQVGVPVLSEIPIAGGLFRSQVDDIQKVELVVLIKATIVDGNESIHDTDKDLFREFSGDRRPFSL